jgi:hypothetical protein
LGIPQTTIKSRFYSGMRKLKQKYFDTNLWPLWKIFKT